jgi:hypothetical protein
MKKKDMAKINPKLLTSRIEIQKLERYNSFQGKDDCLTLNKNYPAQAHY